MVQARKKSTKNPHKNSYAVVSKAFIFFVGFTIKKLTSNSQLGLYNCKVHLLHSCFV